MQTNADDCGFYLLHFASCYMADPDKYRAIIKVRSCATLTWSDKLTSVERKQAHAERVVSVHEVNKVWRESEALQFRDQLRKYVESEIEVSEIDMAKE